MEYSVSRAGQRLVAETLPAQNITPPGLFGGGVLDRKKNIERKESVVFFH